MAKTPIFALTAEMHWQKNEKMHRTEIFLEV